MSDPPERADRGPGVAADLVEYIVVAFPDRAALGSVVPALTDMVRWEQIRVLDVAVLVRGADGDLAVLEVGDVDELAGLATVDGEVGLLSENDLRLTAGAVGPGMAGLVLVAEDRWAAQLAAAAHGVGGRIVAGERVPSSRVEAALTHPAMPEEEREDAPEHDAP